MATLTETAFYSRIAFKWIGILLVAMMVGRVVWGMGVQIYKALNPEPPPPATIGFGKLPDLPFPKKDVPTLTYHLETPTGGLPTFPDRVEVYFMPVEKPSLLALENAKVMAREFGFRNDPEQRSEILFRWQKDSPISTTLDMFIYRGNFVMSADWYLYPTYLQEKNLPSEQQALNDVRGQLQRGAIMGTDLMDGKYILSYLKASGGSYQETVSQSEADFIRIDLFRKTIKEEYEVVTSDPKQGVVRAILSGNQQLGRLVYLEFNYYPVDYNTFHTYPLKPVSLAWNELQTGKAYIASIAQGAERVVVRRVTLGYFDSFEAQNYLQPVYIFRGDNGFEAHVPALLPYEEILKQKPKN